MSDEQTSPQGEAEPQAETPPQTDQSSRVDEFSVTGDQVVEFLKKILH